MVLDELSTLTFNEDLLPGRIDATVPVVVQMTPVQAKAMVLLGVDPNTRIFSAITVLTRQIDGKCFI